MGQYQYIRKLFPNIQNVLDRELLMDLTSTRPANHLVIETFPEFPVRIACGKDDLLSSLTRNITRKVFIGQKDHCFCSQRVYDVHGVWGRTANICFSFYVRIGVDIRDYRNSGELLLQIAYILGSNAGCQRTTRLQRRYEPLLSWIQNLSRLCHELNAAKNDYVLFRFGCFATQFQRVTNKIWYGMKESGLHIVVTKYHRVLFLLKHINLRR